MTAQPLRLVEATVDEKSVQPGVESIRVAQRAQIAPRPYERLLDRVLGLVGIVQDQPSGAIQPRDRGGRKRGKGVMIAPPRPLHELSLHACPSVARRPT